MLCSAAGLIASQAAAGGVMLTVVHELVSIMSGQASTVCSRWHPQCSNALWISWGLLTAGAQQAQERQPAGLGATGHCELHVVAAGPPGTPCQCAHPQTPKHVLFPVHTASLQP